MCLNPYLVPFYGIGAVISGHTILLASSVWPGSSASCHRKFWSSFLLSFLDCSTASSPVLFIWPRAFQDRTRIGIQICVGWRGTCGNLEGYWTIGRNSEQWKKYRDKISPGQKPAYRHFLVLLRGPLYSGKKELYHEGKEEFWIRSPAVSQCGRAIQEQ